MDCLEINLAEWLSPELLAQQGLNTGSLPCIFFKLKIGR
jgi:hypothetical protein